mmetsp:Transcript_27096/g.31276  ORF Transcript_27096/g.31276 Transcript_27096/m.31276 type:complete len:80 (-) Transcript_27096:3173-3412(-)
MCCPSLFFLKPLPRKKLLPAPGNYSRRASTTDQKFCQSRMVLTLAFCNVSIRIRHHPLWWMGNPCGDRVFVPKYEKVCT